eukprot:1278182-Rhodomonas_salina.1
MHWPKGYGQCETRRGRQQQDKHALMLSLASVSAPASNSALRGASRQNSTVLCSGVHPSCITSIHSQKLVQA